MQPVTSGPSDPLKPDQSGQQWKADESTGLETQKEDLHARESMRSDVIVCSGPLCPLCSQSSRKDRSLALDGVN